MSAGASSDAILNASHHDSGWIDCTDNNGSGNECLVTKAAKNGLFHHQELRILLITTFDFEFFVISDAIE